MILVHPTVAGTLGRYFALNFLRAVIAMFVGIYLLVTLIDYFEMLRRAGGGGGGVAVSAWLVAQTTLCRIPQLCERILPFIVLVSAMASFFSLSRRLELVVVRSAGVSAWQFLSPALLVAMLLGLAATTLYNPVSAALQEQSRRLELQVFGGQPGLDAQSGGDGFWMRQQSEDGQSIVHAQTSSGQGRELGGVTFYLFDGSGRFYERIEATTASLTEGRWRLGHVRAHRVDAAPTTQDVRDVPTNLTPEQVHESFATPDSVSFWSLPAYVEAAERSGLRAAAYRLQYQKLLSQPFLLAAMVLLAAAVSLRFFRLGGIQKMVICGVVAAFAVYALSKVTDDLGRAELMSPVTAAWLPVVAAALTGLLALLFQEDG